MSNIWKTERDKKRIIKRAELLAVERGLPLCCPDEEHLCSGRHLQDQGVPEAYINFCQTPQGHINVVVNDGSHTLLNVCVYMWRPEDNRLLSTSFKTFL